MKAIVYNRNSPDKLIYRDIQKPVPYDDELLVRLHASSINAADNRAMKMGLAPKKRIFGADISGVVEYAGSNVRQFKAGDEVAGITFGIGFGGFAEYIAVPERVLTIKPKEITFEDAAALSLAGITALQALRNIGSVRSGQKVLIVGCSGGVGNAAVQLAKYFGANVTGVCSAGNAGQAKLLGADRVIDYAREDFSAETGNYDLILAVNGNYPVSAYKRCLKRGGKYVLIGGSISQIIKSILFGKLLFVGSGKTSRFLAMKIDRKDLDFLFELAAEGRIKPVIEKIFSLEKAAEAMKYAASGHARGKVVVKVR